MDSQSLDMHSLKLVFESSYLPQVKGMTLGNKLFVCIVYLTVCLFFTPKLWPHPRQKVNRRKFWYFERNRIREATSQLELA